MLYAQNGSTDAKLRCDEHGDIICRLEKKMESTLVFTSGSGDTVHAREPELAGEVGAGVDGACRREGRRRPEPGPATRGAGRRCGGSGEVLWRRGEVRWRRGELLPAMAHRAAASGAEEDSSGARA